MELGPQDLREAVRRCATATKARAIRRRYPPLAGNQSITMASPVNSIRMVLNGGYPPGTKKNPRPHGMPPFSHILNDDEVAAVVTYIRVAWDNSGTPVTPGAGQRAAQAAAGMKEPTHGRRPIDARRPRRTTTARSTRSSAAGPSGAFAVAGVATAIVVAIYFVFYFFVYLPRGAVQ